MKCCPQCKRVEIDESLRFCRVDGAVLVDDSAIAEESFATRILPASPTGSAHAVKTDSGHAQTITPGLEPAKQTRLEIYEASDRTRLTSSSSLVSRLKHRKTIAILVGALLIAAAVLSYFYFQRRSESAATIDSREKSCSRPKNFA